MAARRRARADVAAVTSRKPSPKTRFANDPPPCTLITIPQSAHDPLVAVGPPDLIPVQPHVHTEQPLGLVHEFFVVPKQAAIVRSLGQRNAVARWLFDAPYTTK